MVILDDRDILFYFRNDSLENCVILLIQLFIIFYNFFYNKVPYTQDEVENLSALTSAQSTLKIKKPLNLKYYIID